MTARGTELNLSPIIFRNSGETQVLLIIGLLVAYCGKVELTSKLIYHPALLMQILVSRIRREGALFTGDTRRPQGNEVLRPLSSAHTLSILSSRLRAQVERLSPCNDIQECQ